MSKKLPKLIGPFPADVAPVNGTGPYLVECGDRDLAFRHFVGGAWYYGASTTRHAYPVPVRMSIATGFDRTVQWWGVAEGAKCSPRVNADDFWKATR